MNLIRTLSVRINQLSWQLQTFLFLGFFLFVTAMCAPRGMDFAGLTVNQFLEDFGVFSLFLSLWSGVYALFRRNISVPALVAIFGVALFVEEFNLLNRIYFLISTMLGFEVTIEQRQRGDVISVLAVTAILLVMCFRQNFRSVFRIFIAIFLTVYASFQVLIHMTFPYDMQRAMIAPQMDYQAEFASTYPGRFSFVCEQEGKDCYEWNGHEPGDIDPGLLKYPNIHSEVIDLLARHEGVFMNTMGFVGTLPSEDDNDIFIGINSSRNYILTFYRNGDLNRVVLDFDYIPHVSAIVSRPLVIFSTAFVIVWFFGGLAVVLMHQQGFKKSEFSTSPSE